MLRDQIASVVEEAVASLVDSGAFPEALRAVRVEIQDTKDPAHRDFASNVAMVGAKAAGTNPRALAEALAAQLGTRNDLFSAVEVAGPGFLNFRLQPETVARWVGEVLVRGERYACSSTENPQRINVEFVSVNPNGPITVGSGRGAAFGSALSAVLEAAGHEVHREYYINDGVNSEQMRLFAESVRALILGEPLPEKGYKGDYVQAVAETVTHQLGKGYAPQLQYCREQLSESADTEAQKWRQHTLRRHLAALERVEAMRSASPSPQSVAKGLDGADLKLFCETLMSDKQSEDLAAFGVEFDTWFSEQALHDAGEVEKVIERLAAKGVADEQAVRTKLKLAKGGKVEDVEKEPQTGAVDDEGNALQDAGGGSTLWLRSTKFGDDMDRVLRRQDGRLTYIASDVAYHEDKFSRGNQDGTARADKLITVLGPDHHGYIGRLTAVVAALLETPAVQSTGEPLSETEAKLFASAEERDACRAALEEAKRRLEVVIFQIVRFVKEGKPAPMRKRDGNIYALIDLIDELGKNLAPDADQAEQRRVGRDVARFFYLMRSHDTALDFDIDLATKQSDENPVFYVQYAHARICSVVAKAREAGFAAADGFDPAQLSHPRELALIKKTLDLPYEVRRCAEDYGVHRLATYAVELARAYHHFYDACRVIQPDAPESTRARLALCEAARVALAGALGLLGVSAPERMDRATLGEDAENAARS